MARFASFALAVFTICCVLIATERSAWGYIDPGAGFVALQTFASALAAAGYFMRRRIRSFFVREPAAQSGTPAKVVSSEPTKAA